MPFAFGGQWIERKSYVLFYALLSDHERLKIFLALFGGTVIASLFVLHSGGAIFAPFSRTRKLTRFNAKRHEMCLYFCMATGVGAALAWVLYTPACTRAAFMGGLFVTRWVHTGDLEKILSKLGKGRGSGNAPIGADLSAGE